MDFQKNNVDYLLTGWGNLIFFDVSEYDVSVLSGENIVTLLKLAPQWKVHFEFKPGTTNNAMRNPALSKDILWICETSSCQLFLSTSFKFPRFGFRLPDPSQADEHKEAEFVQFPKFDEWTCFEICCEEREPGKFFVSLAVEGKILGSLETLSKERTEAVVSMGRKDINDLPWLIGRLAVAERFSLLFKSSSLKLVYMVSPHECHVN